MGPPGQPSLAHQAHLPWAHSRARPDSSLRPYFYGLDGSARPVENPCSTPTQLIALNNFPKTKIHLILKIKNIKNIKKITLNGGQAIHTGPKLMMRSNKAEF